MLVPALISFPVSKEGTVEKAHPGASRSGLPDRPPRPLNEPTKSPATGGAPSPSGGREKPRSAPPPANAPSAAPGRAPEGNPGAALSARISDTTHRGGGAYALQM